MATEVKPEDPTEAVVVPEPGPQVDEDKLVKNMLIPMILSKGIDLADDNLDQILTQEIRDTIKDDPAAIAWFDGKTEAIISRVKSDIQPIIAEQQDRKMISREEYIEKWKISDDQVRRVKAQTEIEIYKKISNDFQLFGKLLDKNLAIMNKKFGEMKKRLDKLDDDYDELSSKYQWLAAQKVKYYFIRLPVINRLFRRIKRYRATKIISDINDLKNDIKILKSLIIGEKLPGLKTTEEDVGEVKNAD